jgi:hypothetical protein
VGTRGFLERGEPGDEPIDPVGESTVDDGQARADLVDALRQANTLGQRWIGITQRTKLVQQLRQQVCEGERLPSVFVAPEVESDATKSDVHALRQARDAVSGVRHAGVGDNRSADLHEHSRPRLPLTLERQPDRTDGHVQAPLIPCHERDACEPGP